MGSTPSVWPSARRFSMTVSQSAVRSAGRRASLITRRRQRPRESKLCEAGQGMTSVRVMPARVSRRFIAPCGCCSPTSSQASAARLSSRPGSTTAPWGAWAITRSRSAVAGAVPVEPAAISTPCGGFCVQVSASRRSRATRRPVVSTRPMSASRLGHSFRAVSRKWRLTCQCSARSALTRSASPSPGTSSICRLSRKPPKASANSSAAEASRSRPSARSFSLTSRVSSKRRCSGAMAAGRSTARSPGSNGGSPSSRSPSGRICGGSTAAPPPAAMKASASERAPRRVGVRITAWDSASGPSGMSAS